MSNLITNVLCANLYNENNILNVKYLTKREKREIKKDSKKKKHHFDELESPQLRTNFSLVKKRYYQDKLLSLKKQEEIEKLNLLEQSQKKEFLRNETLESIKYINAYNKIKLKYLPIISNKGLILNSSSPLMCDRIDMCLILNQNSLKEIKNQRNIKLNLTSNMYKN